jgi:GTP pyrophosphokinase
MMANYGYRIIKVRWTAQHEAAFLTGLRIAGTDRIGLISDVTKVISAELKVNMRSITIDTHEGVFDGKIMLYVSDTSHLDKLISKLKKVNGVFGISRFEN